jgi:hypothetical protein
MHFRVHYELEFGLGKWRQREDLLGLKPHEKAGVPAPEAVRSDVAGAAVVDTSKSPLLAPDVQPKRVSITAEDRALLRSPHQLRDDSGLSDDEMDQDPAEVAEILRQMCRAPTSESDKMEKLSDIPNAAKRDTIPNFFLEPDTDSVAAGPSPAKRVRWSTESLSHQGTIPLASQASQVAATNRFFHKMRRGLSLRNTNTATDPTAVVASFPVLKPIPGLEAYDVLLRKDFISHFNLGNRRFLVLAFPHVAQGACAPQMKQDELTRHIMTTVIEAGGRFVFMEASCRGFEVLSQQDATVHVAEVLQRLSKHCLGGKGLLRLFERDCADVWGDTAIAEAEASALEKKDPPRLTAVTLQPTDASAVDASTVNDVHENDARAQGPASQKVEPQRTLLNGFEPGQYDVICCRGRGPRKHPGNVWFLDLVESKCARYVSAKGKMAKSVIVTEVLDTVRNLSGNGGFVKTNDDGEWYEVGDHIAREKIGQVSGRFFKHLCRNETSRTTEFCSLTARSPVTYCRSL